MNYSAFLGALKSKTVWASLLLALVTALVEPVQVLIAANPGTFGTVVAAVFALLRTITTSALSAKA